MNSSQHLWNTFLAWLVTAPIVGKLFWGNKLLRINNSWSDWYEKNNAYKFGIYESIRPGWFPDFGYGVNPHGMIVGHTKDELGRDMYRVSMVTTTQNADGTWSRLARVEIHNKWGIEHHFQRTTFTPTQQHEAPSFC